MFSCAGNTGAHFAPSHGGMCLGIDNSGRAIHHTGNPTDLPIVARLTVAQPIYLDKTQILSELLFFNSIE
jgi:hypothetical protein